MRTLYIHVGPPKTGTSAIQHFFRLHPSAPVLYPEVGLWPDGSHHNLVLNFYGDYRRQDVTRTPIKELLENLRQRVRGDARDILISSEALAWRTDVRTFAEALGNELSSTVSAVRLVFVCREHFERVASSYNQLVKDAFHCETKGPDTYLRQHANAYVYSTMLSRLQETGFDLKVLNYHPAETLVQRFAALLGWPIIDPPGVTRRNVSISIKGLIALLSVNQVVGCGSNRTSYFGELKKTKRFWGGSGYIFDPAVGNEVQRLFEDDRALLKREFDCELPPLRAILQENKFFLTRPEFEEMAAAVRRGGDGGEAITEVMRQYVKDS